ncbi:YraN family protein [Dehalococcoides mccartyi]|jgi:putative endonuclease|uniref:YraN family protein n=1 Tax=Dehalococcoides mccartyi TaxID=61435 RepID=UPI00099B4F24|nr:YraN family protein [Dehalococcoides mccartyi]AQX74539.1 YraN family protein [Dehalococcoides mccartyi]AQY73117.1 YraN family protein [Dehalococcoides mccartyi]
MAYNRKETGEFGEKLAAEYLKGMGYRIIQTNCRLPEGEIDIVGQDGEYLVFIEVRTKRRLGYGLPAESVTPRKKAHLMASAESYIQKHRLEHFPCRIDFVSVDLSQPEPRLELIKNALGEE